MDNARREDGRRNWPSIDTASGPGVTTLGRPARDDLSRDSIKGRLSNVVEDEIIPRLMLAHRSDGRRPVPSAEPLQELDAFVEAILGTDPVAGVAMVDRLRDGGLSIDRLFLDLLAPAAKRLGVMWEADLADFMEVTVALSRLQQMLRELTPRGQGPDLKQPDGSRRILLTPAPGERHTFGLSMVEKFFRSSGWDVASLAASPHLDAVALVRREWFAVIGLSLSCETGVDALSAFIRKLRKASRNESVGILVGGDYFVRNPGASLLIGADAMATDGLEAVAMARSLLDLKARAC